MSRSFKKYPICRYDSRHGARWAKAQASRKFRRDAEQDLLSGKTALHRRYYDSRNIHDEYRRWTRKDAEEGWAWEEFLMREGITDRFRISWHLRFGNRRRLLSYWAKKAIRK